MKFAVATLALLLTACTSGPTFSNIQSVKVTRVGSGGLQTIELDATHMRRAIDCLYATQEVRADASDGTMLLQDVYLLEIQDAAGIRSFELYTARHLKGNKGKYYANNCLYDLIRT